MAADAGCRQGGAPPGFAEAVAQWQAVLGVQHVVMDAPALCRVGTTTFATTSIYGAIVRPASRQEVIECVKIASAQGVGLYPTSAGKNWGLGGRVAIAPWAVLLDLSRMDRIESFDPVHGVLRVEPGVTFRQVYEFLKAQGSDYWLAPIGGSDLASVVGNTLERGEGVGPLGDRSNHVAALEVVLADGEVLHTGFSRFPGARTAGLGRNGVGPSVEGLFMQSNLGIVTGLTVWLSKYPVFQARFMIDFADPEQAGAGLEALRTLHQQRLLGDCCYSIWNRNKFLALVGDTSASAPGEAGLTEGGRPSLSVPLVGGYLLAGSAAVGQATVEALHDALQGRCVSIHHEVVTDADWLARKDLDIGYPNPVNLKTVYVQRKVAHPTDPETDRCGVVWLCPALPHEPAAILGIIDHIERMGHSRGFQVQIGLVALTARLVHGFISLVYDRDIVGMDDAAMECHDAMLDWLVEQGYPPYRLGIHSMRWLHANRTTHSRLLENIRAQLDPDGIIAAGRYVG